MLPGLNGMEVLRRIRRLSSVPVIMLTARDSIVDKVSGLDHGADDYITKPFAIEELLARIRTALRRSGAGLAQEESVLSAGDLRLDVLRRRVTVRGTPVELTKREFDLLKYLLENKGVVASREALLQNVWGFDFEGETNAVDVYIRFLRSKIDEVFGIKTISTVRGVGYVIRDED
jgi:DNA-binding response OmpR family regulator